MKRAADVCVIGGGLLGTAIAYFASRAGLSTILLEAGDLAAGASGASFGGVSTSIYRYSATRVPSHYVLFSRAGLELYHELQAELGPPLDFTVKGELDLFEDEAARPLAVERVAGLNVLGVPVSLIEAGEVREMEPAVSESIAFATYSPVDAFVSPQFAVWAFADGTRRNGGEIRTGAPVSGLVVDGYKVVGVETLDGRITADWVVLAAGVGTVALAESVGVPVPLAYSRGQMLVTERIPPLLSTYIHGIKQTSSGTVLIGVTIEPNIADTATTVASTRELLSNAVRLVPALAQSKLLRSWAGVRPVPADGYPILGPAPGLNGLLLAVMHRGVTLAPAVGKSIVELMTQGATDIDIAAYDPGRFGEAAAPEARVRDHPDYVY